MVGPASDIYSLGVVLFEVISGGLPYRNMNSVDEARNLHAEQQRQSLRSVSALPSGLPDLIDSMLDRFPDRRPTASEVVLKLSQFPTTVVSERSRSQEPFSQTRPYEPPPTPPPGLGVRQPAASKTTPLILAAVAVVVSALIGGVLLFGHKDTAPEGRPSSASSAPYVNTAPEPEVRPTEQIRRKPDPPPIPSEPRDQPPIPRSQKVEPSIRATREAQEARAKEQLEAQEKAKEQAREQAIKEAREQAIKDGISRAQSEYSQGHYGAALGFLRNVLRIDPKNEEAIRERDKVIMPECAPISACEAK
jgi:hypothetical protein